MSSFRIALIAFSAVLVPLTFAQTDARIQDNSFLVEEAYNQEFGFVQHISNFVYLADSKDWAYTFTQEWPVTGIRHQFSYTLIALRQGSFSSQDAGFGDVFLNYRYQAIGNGETRVAFAPRLSLIVPSGNSNLGQGFGAAGAQTNLPLAIKVQIQLTAQGYMTTLSPAAPIELVVPVDAQSAQTQLASGGQP